LASELLSPTLGIAGNERFIQRRCLWKLLKNHLTRTTTGRYLIQELMLSTWMNWCGSTCRARDSASDAGRNPGVSCNPVLSGLTPLSESGKTLPPSRITWEGVSDDV
jgi:hypothetical protein